MVGGNATPPPVNCGARIVPARARPVPFCRHGFERPPETSPRLFAARVPARSALNSARTTSWTRCGLTSAPKTVASSVKSFAFLPAASRTGAFGAVPLLAMMRPVLSDLDERILGAGNRALDEEEVPLRINLVDDQPDLGLSLAAHAAGHLPSLEDSRRRRRRADRAGLADVVR